MSTRNLLFFLFLTLSLNGYAQSYELTITSETYTDLLGSTSLNDGITWDDPGYLIPMGFEFQFFDETFDEISILEIGLGGSLSTPTSDDTFPFLTPYGADIIDRGYDFTIDEPSAGSLSNISYLLEGTEGNRILKIEWNNVGFYSELDDDNVSSDFTNFQLWLYEGTNDIEMRYGNNSITQPELSYDEQTGSWIGLFERVGFDDETFQGETLALTGTPENAELVDITDNIDELVFLDGTIPEGTVYRFSRTNISATKNEINASLDITPFPNPVNTHLNLRMDDPSFQIESVAIHNLSGQLLQEVEYIQQPIDVSYLGANIYVLEIATTAGTVYRKMVKK